jgi:hypothetical protein
MLYKTNGTTILERGLPICGLRPVSKSMTFSTPHKGHLRHVLFFTRLDCQNLLKRTMTYPVSQYTQSPHHLDAVQQHLNLNKLIKLFAGTKQVPQFQYKVHKTESVCHKYVFCGPPLYRRASLILSRRWCNG